MRTLPDLWHNNRIPQSAHFQRTRQDHRRETAEDYVELIYRRRLEAGAARAVDLAEALGVSKVTVSKTLSRLERDGLVIRTANRTLELTSAGQDLAQNAEDRHEVVLAFLLAMGIRPETAAIDSEGIEHHVSQETLDAMRAFVDREKKGRRA